MKLQALGQSCLVKVAILILVAVLGMFVLAGRGGTDASSRASNEGLLLLDILLVRPVSLAVVAANALSYPPAALFVSVFGGDPEAFAEWWLMESYRHTFDRPLGDFKWKPRKHQKEERQ